jgi:hypothetical protein
LATNPEVFKKIRYEYSEIVTPTYGPQTFTTTLTVNNTSFDSADFGDWRQNIRDRVQACTIGNGTRKSYIFSDGSFYGRVSIKPAGKPREWQSLYAIGCFTAGHADPPALPAAVTSVTNAAKSRLASKIIQVNRELQGGVVLGEMRETLRLIKSPAKALREGIPRYLASLKKKTKGVKSRTIAKNIISESYLEWTFGAKPLMSDIVDGHRAIRRLHSRMPRDTKDIRVVESKDSMTTPVITTHLIGATSYLRTIDMEYTTSNYIEKWQACVGYATYSPRFMQAQLLGFHPSEFVPTLYELLPWSFLIDYFTNLGDVISSHCLYTGLVRWVMRTDIKESSRVYVATPNTQLLITTLNSLSTATGASATGTPAKGVVLNRSVFRRDYSGSLIPSFQFELPGRSSQWVNMAALIGARKESRKMFSHL